MLNLSADFFTMFYIFWNSPGRYSPFQQDSFFFFAQIVLKDVFLFTIL